MAVRFRPLIVLGALGAALVPLAWGLGRCASAGEPGARFLTLFAGASVLYLGSERVWRRLPHSVQGGRRALGLVLTVAALARLAIFAMPASDDVYRYLWEGRFQHLGGNPYRTAPAEMFQSVPDDPYLSRVNHPELTTIYPPVSELTFREFTRWSYDLSVWKAFVVALELLLVLLLLKLLALKQEPPSSVLRYAWHPLPWVAFAGEGHADVLMLCATWVGWIALTRSWRIRAGLALGAAIGAKFVSGLYFPIWARRVGGGAAVLGLVASTFPAWPYRDAGWDLLRVLGVFGWQMGHNGSLQVVFAELIGPVASRVAVAGLLGVVGLWIWLRDPAPMRAGGILTMAFLLLSPTVHPWYGTWLVPFLVFHPFRSGVALTLLLGLAYLAYGARAATGEFHLSTLVRVLEWGPVYGLVAWELARGFRTGRPVSGPSTS